MTPTNTMGILSKLVDSGATITIEPEGDDGPGCITITDGPWQRTQQLIGGPQDLPLEFERVVALWEEYRSAR